MKLVVKMDQITTSTPHFALYTVDNMFYILNIKLFSQGLFLRKLDQDNIHTNIYQGFPGGPVVKNSPANAGDAGDISFFSFFSWAGKIPCRRKW